MVHTARKGPLAERNPRRASLRACRRSASCSRCSSSERVPPQARRTGRTWKPPRRRGLHNGRTCLSLSWRRRASVLQRASPPGRTRRRRRPGQEDALHKPCTAPLPCVRAFASCSSPWPFGVGPRGTSPRRGPRQPYAWHSVRARRPVPSRCRLRTGCARARGVVSRTWGTIPARVDLRRVCGGVRVLSCVPAHGSCTASSLLPLSAAGFGRRGRSNTRPNIGPRCPWCAGPYRR